MTDVAATLNEPSPARPAPPRRGHGSLMHSGMTASRFVGMHAMGAIFPVTAGVVLFGWRAVGTILIVLFSTAIAHIIWKRVGSRGEQLRFDHCMWLAVLLVITLPPQLCTDNDPISGLPLWPIAAGAGVLLVMFTWLLGGIGSGRVQPVLVTQLLIFAMFSRLLVPQFVLQRGHIVLGDIFRATPEGQTITQPWIRAPVVESFDALQMQPASDTLLSFTWPSVFPNRAWISLDALLRDRMPPLEDLIIGGHPAPIGLGSAIAVIIGGLFLLYRGLIDYHVPLFIILTAAAFLLILPVPAVIREPLPGEATVIWRSIQVPWHEVGWPVSMTLVSYELMAGPLLFMAFFLATSPAVRPVARRARALYAIIAGALAAVCQVYVSVAVGPYLALLVASFFTPTFDRFFRPRTLV